MNSSEQFIQVSTKPPPVPNIGRVNQGIDNNGATTKSTPPSAAVARSKIALLKQMHGEQQKVDGAQLSSASAASFDPSSTLQQILLKQAVASSPWPRREEIQ